MLAYLFGSSTQAPVLLKLRSSKTFIVVTVATAIFTDIFVYGIVVPVLPFALESRAGVQPDVTQQWISIFLAVYGGALLVAAPICGWFADRTTSRRMPMILGLFALGGATVILCVGSSITVLAIGRTLQGIAAAVPWVVGLALLVDTAGPDEVGLVMGYVGLSMSLAMLVAPLLGGVVFAQSGYYAVFAMAFGLMVLDIFLRVVMIEKKMAKQWLPDPESEESKPTKSPEEDRKQSVTDIEMETIDADTTKDTPQPANRIPAVERTPSKTSARSACEEIIPPTVPSTIKRWTSRLPPVFGLLASHRILTAIFGCMIQATLLTAFDSILPLFVRDTFHWNSIGAGLIFLPIVVVSFLGPIFGNLSDKHGPRWYATTGFVLACPFLILLRLVTTNTLDQKVLLCALLALIGVSLTMMLTPLMAEIAYAVEAKARKRPAGHYGKNGAFAQAYALFNMAFAGGCLFGPLLAGLVTQANGWSVATLILGCVSIFTAIPTVIWTGGSMFKRRRRKREESEAVEFKTPA